MVLYFLTSEKKKNIYRSSVKGSAKNPVTRPCVAVLIIFNTFPCSGIKPTGGVQLESGAVVFNPSPIVALKWRLYRWLWH